MTINTVLPMQLPPGIDLSARPPQPGLVLLEQFLHTRGMTQKDVARAIRISVQGINLIINGKRGITAEMALRLGRYFSTPPEYWMDLQRDWDLWRARHIKQLDAALATIPPAGSDE